MPIKTRSPKSKAQNYSIVTFLICEKDKKKLDKFCKKNDVTISATMRSVTEDFLRTV